MSDNSLVKSKKIDTRLDDYLFALVDAYAKRHGLKRTQVIVRALEKYFGIQHADPVEFASRNILPTTAFHAPETTVMQEDPGNICELPVPGSSPAKTQVRYKKGTGPKS
jgi:hypothetical protein